MRHIGTFALLVVAVVGFAWVSGADDHEPVQKTCDATAVAACGAKSDPGECNWEAESCAAERTCGGKSACAAGGACAKDASGSKACGGKCTDTVATATPRIDCPGCAPVVAVGEAGGHLKVDAVRLDRGVALVFVTSNADQVADLQKAILAVNGNVARAVAAPSVPDGLCRQCTVLTELARAGTRSRVELTSSGAVVVLTGTDDATVTSLQAWADGLKKAVTAMASAVSQAG